MKRCRQARAVDELLERSSLESYAEILEEMWECWLTHEDNSNVDQHERKDKLYHYKSVKQFLTDLAG